MSIKSLELCKVRCVTTLFLAAILFSTSCTESKEVLAKKRANILFIIADDQSPFTLKAYGNTVCQTPTLDRLSEQGITLDGAYHMGSWSGAVCLPSRTMIQTSFNVWKTKEIKEVTKRIDTLTYVHDPEGRLAEFNTG